MSNYDAPDKSVGDAWTATEHNALKEAVNSKFDAGKIVQDLSNPDAAKVLSTAGISLLGVADFQRKGKILSSENLNLITNPGHYWFEPFLGVGGTGWPIRTPSPFTKGGSLLVFSDVDKKEITQIIISKGDNDTDSAMTVRKTSAAGATWESWDFTVFQRWLQDRYGDGTGLAGNPVIKPYPGLTFTKTECRDLMGKITVDNVSSDTTDKIVVVVAFEFTRNGLSTIQLQAMSGGIVDFNVAKMDGSGFSVYIAGNLPIGSNASFFYFLK